jgi:ParB-like chromosome segregation protein Spo0J
MANNEFSSITSGEMLKEEILAEYGLSQNQLAKAIGLSPNRIAETIGTAAIVATVADPTAFKSGCEFAAGSGWYRGRTQAVATSPGRYLQTGRPISAQVTDRWRHNGAAVCTPSP